MPRRQMAGAADALDGGGVVLLVLLLSNTSASWHRDDGDIAERKRMHADLCT